MLFHLFASCVCDTDKSSLYYQTVKINFPIQYTVYAIPFRNLFSYVPDAPKFFDTFVKSLCTNVTVVTFQRYSLPSYLPSRNWKKRKISRKRLNESDISPRLSGSAVPPVTLKQLYVLRGGSQRYEVENAITRESTNEIAYYARFVRRATHYLIRTAFRNRH